MSVATVDFKNGVAWTGAVASDVVGPFTLLGGTYMFAVFDTGTANATLEVQTPGGHYANVGSAVVTNSATAVQLGAGTYKVVNGAGITLGEGSVVPIPNRTAT